MRSLKFQKFLSGMCRTSGIFKEKNYDPPLVYVENDFDNDISKVYFCNESDS